MSAFMVPIEHIRAMVNAGLNIEYGLMTWLTAGVLMPSTAEKVGAMLLAENQRSVNYRYNEQKLEEHYTHGPSSPRSPVEILFAIACYEYQSCETPDWEQSEAAAFCRKLRMHMIVQIPGYGDAQAWPITTA
ncbi:hypothetical protein [Leucobacter sp. wl10]|uniref:hypothetical protein n=1 Tax=Leucobacter sp. wl10 TaxID=2304677 RepID=UPI000E5A9AA6|nr:hypothetical protein [Leucobacter sp. wl10]RGE19028.1 hypothetical protein D1J51_12935 [Leucobacter sp. wl10]